MSSASSLTEAVKQVATQTTSLTDAVKEAARSGIDSTVIEFPREGLDRPKGGAAIVRLIAAAPNVETLHLGSSPRSRRTMPPTTPAASIAPAGRVGAPAGQGRRKAPPAQAAVARARRAAAPPRRVPQYGSRPHARGTEGGRGSAPLLPRDGGHVQPGCIGPVVGAQLEPSALAGRFHFNPAAAVRPASDWESTRGRRGVEGRQGHTQPPCAQSIHRPLRRHLLRRAGASAHGGAAQAVTFVWQIANGRSGSHRHEHACRHPRQHGCKPSETGPRLSAC